MLKKNSQVKPDNFITILDKIDGKFVPQVTYSFYRFFTTLSWYSKVRDSESLLLQVAVNRD